MTPRPNTPDRKNPDGSTTMRVKRLCNGCREPVGDATEEEMDAAVMGLPLPDVHEEHGCQQAVITQEGRNWLAWCHPCQDGYRGRRHTAEAWAEKHNTDRHPKAES